MAESDIQADPPPPPERRRPPPRYEDDVDDDRYEDAGEAPALIPYKNPMGLIAYYLGVFSLIPCIGAILGPAALILGIKGLRFSQRNPSAKGGAHAITGIVLGALTSMFNWAVIIILVVAMGIAGFKK
jgi:hypothetical protein